MAKQPAATPPEPQPSMTDATIAFRKRISATTPPARFGDVPAAKARIDLALAAVARSRANLEAAAATLADLEAEIVTGSNPPESGARAILGDDLPLYRELIADARAALNRLAGEV